MIRVVLIGSGNLAYHLHKALLKAEGVALLAMSSRRAESLVDFEAVVPRLPLGAPHKEADLYILAVSDEAIASVVELYQGEDALFVHTSGAMGISALGSVQRKGVLYPLQTFSRDREISFETIPICVEAALYPDTALLTDLARALSKEVYELSEEERRSLHLAAVYVNNFSNHMLYLGEMLCKRAGLPEKLLHPLIGETFAKVKDLSAYEAQTGPARRKDLQTQKAHLQLLEKAFEKELYTMISESIRRTYE